MFVVLSLFTLYVFLLGCAVAPVGRPGARASAQVAAALALGILLNYSLTLTGLALGGVFAAGGSLALLGALRLWKAATRKSPAFSGPSRSRTLLLGISLAYLLALYYFQILSEPLFRWDARSVWFFHSKMIWAEGALRASAGWTHPSVNFSSPDYPNLVPAIGAQLAYAMGHWNEFLPKGTLWVVLVPLVLWIFSFARGTVAFVLLATLYLFSLNAWLWNGYMDAYLTMYCGVVLLCFGRYADERDETDLYGALAALGIAASTKNEGLLFAACAVTAALVAGSRHSALGWRALTRRMRTDRAWLAVLAVSLAPTALWAALKHAWGLQNHLIGAGGGFDRLWSRLLDGTTPQYVFHFLTRRATVFWVLAGLIVVTALFARLRRVRLHPGAWVAGLTTVVYFVGLYVVYLMTPADVTWHLLTSATRVMATVSFGFLITLFFLLSGVEASRRAGRVQPERAAQPARSGTESAARPSGTS